MTAKRERNARTRIFDVLTTAGGIDHNDALNVLDAHAVEVLREAVACLTTTRCTEAASLLTAYITGIETVLTEFGR